MNLKNSFLFFLIFISIFGLILACDTSLKTPQENYLLHIPKDSLYKIDLVQKELLKNKIANIDILKFTQKYYADTFRIYPILRAFCENLENTGLEENDKYFGAIPYKIEIFIEVIKYLKKTKHISFLDVGCGKGEKLFLAKCFGFQQVKGIEYSDTIFKLATKNWHNLLKKNDFEITKKDAFFAENEMKNADFIYMYSPVKDLKMMSELYEKCIRNMKNGSILLEMRMVYSEYLAKKIFKNMPKIIGVFAIKKEKNQFYYLDNLQHFIDNPPIQGWVENWKLLEKI